MARRILAVFFVLTAAGTALSAAGWAETGGDPLAPASERDRYEIRWVEKRAERTFDGDLSEGGDRSYALDIRQSNLTRVDAILSWIETGDTLRASKEDTFRLELRDPTGSPVAASPARGSTNVLVLRSSGLNPLPEPESAGPDDLAFVLGEPTTLGSGVWRAVVALEDAGNPANQKVDKGNTYVLTIVLRWYEASVLRSVTLEPRTLPGPGLTEKMWEYATYGLGGASALLGALLVLGRKRPA